MKGKICLITGGTNGIGKVTAQELAQMGTFVDSKMAQPAAQATDPTVAKKLCDVSSVLVKLTDTMPAAV